METAPTPSGSAACQEREQRIMDAIALRPTDRTPVWCGTPGPFPSARLGIARGTEMMDAEQCLAGALAAAAYYETDMIDLMPSLGAVLEPLGYRQLSWGGRDGRPLNAGFPVAWLAGAQPPFDVLGDFLRGRRSIMLDMYRRPQQLLVAQEKLLPMSIEMGVRAARLSGNPRVFIAIHGGVEGFMSLDQYRKFYWPGLRALLIGLIDAGLTPWVLVEGGANSRLEMMADVPPGRVCYWFENVDMQRARQVLDGIACIAGGVSQALLALGTPDQVRARCRELIATVGSGGGYILGPAGQTEDVRIENVKAMVDCARESSQ